MQKIFYSTNVKTDFLKISIISILNEIDGFFSLFFFIGQMNQMRKMTRNTQKTKEMNKQQACNAQSTYIYQPPGGYHGPI